MDAQAFYKAIADEDQQRLALTPGVGKKLAAKLVLELKGKLPSLVALGGAGATSPGGKLQSEVLEALMGLGFSAAEAQAASCLFTLRGAWQSQWGFMWPAASPAHT